MMVESVADCGRIFYLRGTKAPPKTPPSGVVWELVETLVLPAETQWVWKGDKWLSDLLESNR